MKDLTHFLSQKTTPLDSFEAYRAAKWVAHIATVWALILGALCITLLFMIICLFPLKEVQPMLVTFSDKQEQVVHIEPIDHSVTALTQLQEALCRQYVIWRETWDLQTEETRWHQLSLLSHTTLHQDFLMLMDPRKETSPFAKRRQDKVTRSVRILASTSLAPAAPTVFQVEWMSEDRHQGEIIGQATWLSTLTVTLSPRTFTHDDQFVNPLGITITHYTVAPKVSSTSSLGARS